MSVYLFFGLLWLVNFLSQMTGLITMICAGTYYFNSNAQQEGEADVGFAVHSANFYHMGTVAMASFVLSITSILRFVFGTLLEPIAGDG